MPSRSTLRRRARRRVLTAAWMLALGAALASLVVVRVGLDLRPVAILLVWLACITPLLVAIDIAEHRLPNRIVLPALGVAVPLVVFDTAVQQLPPWEPIGIGLAVGGVLYLCALFGGLGMGDVKLGALLGLAVGCFGPSAAALFAATAVGTAGLAAGIVVLRGRIDGGAPGWRTRIPFGPFLLLGAWTAIALTA